MKAALNGIPQLSTLDGWWQEGYDGLSGWAISPAGETEDADAADADRLYRLLEEQVVPLYYTRDAAGVPLGWVEKMRHALRLAGSRFGADVVAVDLGDAANDEEVLAAFDAAIEPGTRLVAISHVLWTTGARLPIAAIAELAHARGALVAVDGAQAAGAIPVSVADLGVDYYAVAGQKWLLGPEGTGALWVSPEVLERALPSFVSWFTFERITAPTDVVLWPDARRFDDTGYYKPAVVGLARSCGWLSMYVGLPWIHERGQAMAVRAAGRLAAIPGVELLTPQDRMATLVSFHVAGWDAQAALDELAARTFVVARTIPLVDAIRLSIGFFTTEAEIERVASNVELIAAHTPASLPPRQRLTILGQGDG